MTDRHRRRVVRQSHDEQIEVRVLDHLRTAQEALSAAHSDRLALTPDTGADRDCLLQWAARVRAIASELTCLRAAHSVAEAEDVHR